MLDLNHGTGPIGGEEGNRVADTINNLIDAALVEANKRETRREYIGGSAIGNECDRAIQYEYEGVPRDPGKGFSGLTLRIFRAGHAFEALSAEELQAAGFGLKVADEYGKQFGFRVAQGRVRGHVDGVIVSGPPVMAFPALWEHKALGQRSWNEVVKKGVTKARPLYAAQVAIYQAYMGLENPALFTARNRDTQELHHELVPFDASLAQNASDKAARILGNVEGNALSPRAFARADYYICRRCPWSERCWRG
jgi:hypothetical protein